MNYIPYKYDNSMEEDLIINFLLGKIQNRYMAVQTIAHECIHSILDTGYYTEESRNERLVEYLTKGIIELID